MSSESVDSNDENHADNDYPDEESDASDYDSDDSEQVRYKGNECS